MLRPGALVVAIALAGCMDPFVDEQDTFGYLESLSFRASGEYDALAGVATVEMRGEVQAEGTEGLRVDVYVLGRACSLGPEGEPDAWLARETLDLNDPADDRKLSYRALLTARVAAGSEYAAVSFARANNTIGPIFADCVTLRAL